MDEKIRFSVSICVYGKDDPQWFRRAVDSVVNQTLKPSEIVIVVDGPVPEELGMVINEYEKDSLFKVVRLKQNRGHGEARRVGLDNCSNDLVALMDADDISLPERFKKQVSIFQNDPTLSIVGGNISEFIGNETNLVGYRIVPDQHKEICQYLKKRCPFNQMTVMFKKADVKNVGGYVDWYCNEDYYLWARMYIAGMKFANSPDVLVNVRVGKDMYKRRGGWKYFKSEARLQKFMLKKHIIGFPIYLINITKRFILQVMLPNSLRGYIFKKFARTQKS